MTSLGDVSPVWPELFSRVFDQIIDQTLPRHELQCYSLPYGALGFISHVFTYYTIACLWYGRKPLWPFKPIENTRLDLILGIVGVTLCVIMSIVTMVKCKKTWQLLVIAVWKMSMSLLNGITALHVAILVIHKKEDQTVKTRQAAWWLLLYIPGMAAGMAGLMNLVVHVAKYEPDVLHLTIAFFLAIGAALIIGVASMLIICWRGGGAPHKVAAVGLGVTLSLFIMLSAFYSDWCLGLMMDNLLGTPSSDASGLYWTYFIAKRLTMFSW